jgi:type II secretion system protein G
MLKKMKGFTLIELLIVVAILGILAALLIPNAITAIQKAKQKGTMKDMMSISTAIADYITDNGVAPDSADDLATGDAIIGQLSPFYLKVLPLNDQWGFPLYVYCGTGVIGNYGVTNAGYDDFMVASRGRKNEQEGFSYNSADPNSGLFVVGAMVDFENDLIVWNGSWIRAPRIAQQSGS